MRELLSRLVRENPTLLGKMLEFNYYPVLYAEKEALFRYLGYLGDVNVDVVKQSRCALVVLSRYTMERMGLKAFFDFVPLYRRAALLDSSALRRLHLLAGAVVGRGRIASLVGKRERERFFSEVGADIYKFALRRAPLLGIELSSFWKTDDVVEGVRKAGLLVLEATFSNEPEDLRRRVSLKVADINWDNSFGEEEIALSRRLMEKLLRCEVVVPWILRG